MMEKLIESVIGDFIKSIADDPETKQAMKNIILNVDAILTATKQSIEVKK